MDLTNDLRIIYADWPAVDVLWEPKTGQGAVGRAILDQPGTVLLGGEVLATDYGLRYPAGNFPNVKKGDSFTIGASIYIARENAQPVLDGLEHIVPLAKQS